MRMMTGETEVCAFHEFFEIWMHSFVPWQTLTNFDTP